MTHKSDLRNGKDMRSDQVSISLWGAPSSGKTTLIGALALAAGNAGSRTGNWAIYPRNSASADYMARLTQQLVLYQRFPEATLPGDSTPISWEFSGDLAGSVFAPKRRFWSRRSAYSRFELNLVDVAGEAFGYDQSALGPDTETALENLVCAQGLVYLFDPLAELDRRDSAKYVNRTLTNLKARMAGQINEQYLPHQLSVCVTKFDHPVFVMQARRLGLVDADFRVPDSQAEQLFDMCCDGSFWDDDEELSFSGASYVRDQFRSHFSPERTRYYVTSSIGLRRSFERGTDNQLKIRPDDFSNVVVGQDGHLMIRGAIEPINVLEPFISIYQRVSGRRHVRV